MTVAPPFVAGTDHVSEMELRSTVPTVTSSGALGNAAAHGTAMTTEDDAPVPSVFEALTRN
ncbi:unannotated protein [freshwater metagenome]|uniref:Unannotated protein n=1 Tax=freshwater metagenome TaxID=449393 RepID=A0A6J6UPP8_9ZZZZ